MEGIEALSVSAKPRIDLKGGKHVCEYSGERIGNGGGMYTVLAVGISLVFCVARILNMVAPAYRVIHKEGLRGFFSSAMKYCYFLKSMEGTER
jgi:hypothetical protein